MDVDKLKRMAGAVRTGGKGSMRRKKKALHKSNTTDDKRLQTTLKRIGLNTIPAIEEVNIFQDDTVIQFQNPRVQASVAANTWVITGTPQTKKKRLRERVRELAEQNVSLQREVSFLNGREGENMNRISHSEQHLKDLKSSLDEMTEEKLDLDETLANMQEQLRNAIVSWKLFCNI
ncbi:hypothetical protein ACHQM5_024601 [Ranunculus cassubicifolius]